jgi:hypothetical protein
MHLDAPLKNASSGTFQNAVDETALAVICLDICLVCQIKCHAAKRLQRISFATIKWRDMVNKIIPV